jgi:hypothetical protein
MSEAGTAAGNDNRRAVALRTLVARYTPGDAMMSPEPFSTALVVQVSLVSVRYFTTKDGQHMATSAQRVEPCGKARPM